MKVLSLSVIGSLVLAAAAAAQPGRYLPKRVYFDGFTAGEGVAEMKAFASTLLRLRLEPESEVVVIASPVDTACANPKNAREADVFALLEPPGSRRRYFEVSGQLTRSEVTAAFTLQYAVRRFSSCTEPAETVDQGERRFDTGDALTQLNLVADRIAARLVEAASDRTPVRIESKDAGLKSDFSLALEESARLRPTGGEAPVVLSVQRGRSEIRYEIRGSGRTDAGKVSLKDTTQTIPSFARLEAVETVIKRLELAEIRRGAGVTGALESLKTEDLVARARASSDPVVVVALLDERKELDPEAEILLADALAADGEEARAARRYDHAADGLSGQAKASAISKAAAAWEAADRDEQALKRLRDLAALERAGGSLTVETAVRISTLTSDPREAWTTLLQTAAVPADEEAIHGEWNSVLASGRFEKSAELTAACDSSRAKGLHGLLGICLHAQGMQKWVLQDRPGAAQLFQTSADELLKALPWAQPLASNYLIDIANASDWTSEPSRKTALNAVLGALTIRRQVDGADHQRTGDNLHIVGQILYRDGQFEQAREALEQALAIRTRSYASPQARGATLGWLAGTRRRLGGTPNLEEADRLYQSAIAAYKEAGDSAMLPQIYVEHASMLIEMNRLRDATRQDQEALEIATKLEPGGLKRAEILSKLAAVLAEQGRFDEASDAGRQSIAVVSALTDSDSLASRAVVYTEVGTAYLYQGEFASALAQYQTGLDLRMKGPSTIAKGGTEAYAVALAQEYTGLFSESERSYRDSAAIYRQAFGPDSDEEALTLLRLANLLTLTGRYREAAEILMSSGNVVQRLYPQPAERFTIVERERAELLIATGQVDAAMPLVRNALAIRESQEKESVWRRSPYLLQLGRALIEQHREGDAVAPFTQVKGIWTDLKKPSHPDVATAEWGLGIAAGAAGRLDEMTQHCLSALAIATAVAAPQPLRAAAAHACLADAASRRGQVETAVAEQKLALDTFVATIPRAHPEGARLMQRYAELLDTAGKRPDAESMRARAQKILSDHAALER